MLDVHGHLVGLLGSCSDSKAADHRRDGDSEHHHRQLITTSDSAANPEWHVVSLHRTEWIAVGPGLQSAI